VLTYFACEWHHESPEDPVLLYEELDDDRMELRKVEEFRDGRRLRSDRIDLDRLPALSWVEIPSLEEIDADPEFTVLPLTADGFQRVWDSAVDA
jgi:hypothetical protein